jgi:hypothetical protein
MFRYTLIFLLVEAHLFLEPRFKDTAHLFCCASIALKKSMNGKKSLTMPYILLIYRVEIAFGKRQIINCIQQIGFTCSIVTNKAIYPVGK